MKIAAAGEYSWLKYVPTNTVSFNQRKHRISWTNIFPSLLAFLSTLLCLRCIIIIHLLMSCAWFEGKPASCMFILVLSTLDYNYNTICICGPIISIPTICNSGLVPKRESHYHITSRPNVWCSAAQLGSSLLSPLGWCGVISRYLCR